MNDNIRNFLLKICPEILEGEFSQKSIIEYIQTVKILEIEFTGNGCFINLDSENSNFEMEIINKMHNQNELNFDGLELIHKDKNLLCEIRVLIIQQKINLIEIWNKLGSNFTEIPSEYELNKNW